MSVIARLLRFWWDFIVGDDWVIAAGIALAVVATALLVNAGLHAWWLPPIAVVGLLGTSVRREVRRHR